MSKIIIVGGVAGGATAAARIRRLDEQAEIIIFERSGYISYGNCGLPYYIGDVITELEELTLQTPESFLSRYNVDVRVHHEVTAIHPEQKTVEVTNLENGAHFTEAYDQLLLAPGAKPTCPPIPGLDNERIFTLRTVEDTLKIKSFLTEKQPKSAILVGGGAVGLEMAENLYDLGLQITVLDAQPQVIAQLDPCMASFVHASLREKGFKLVLGYGVAGFETAGEQVRVLANGAEPMLADMVIFAIGVTPDTALAKAAGLELGLRGSILVNDRMETSAKDIYAVGDAVEIRNAVSGERALVSLAGPANKQARIAADNICGRSSSYPGAIGSSVIKLFDTVIATTGLNEKTASALGLDFEYVILSPDGHASYYPGAETMTMKVLFERGSGRILGAQIVGVEGVDKRIDVLATAVYAHLTAYDLKNLDLAYSPPFSSAKDPVNMAGFMIENILNGTVKQFTVDEIDELPRDGSVTLLDVRTTEEVEEGYAEGFMNIPVDELRARIGEIPAGKPVYIMCYSGLRSYVANRILIQNGFDCYNFTGGYRFYESFTTEKRVNGAYPCGLEKK